MAVIYHRAAVFPPVRVIHLPLQNLVKIKLLFPCGASFMCFGGYVFIATYEFYYIVPILAQHRNCAYNNLVVSLSLVAMYFQEGLRAR